MTHIEQVLTFLQKYLNLLEGDSASATQPTIPDFDLYAGDYIEFAEESLDRYLAEHRPVELLNCLSHLKRAMDCEIEAFLHAYGLAGIFAKRNIGVGKKLLFIQACGIFSSRTLERLSTFRNRMEHQFEVPEIADIEVYFDLVSAFVALVQTAISEWIQQQLTLTDPNDPDKSCGLFDISYDAEKPNISVSWNVPDEKVSFISTPDNIEEFAFMMKVLFLLRARDSFASDEYILKQLKKTSQQSVPACVAQGAPSAEP